MNGLTWGKEKHGTALQQSSSRSGPSIPGYLLSTASVSGAVEKSLQQTVRNPPGKPTHK